MRLRRWLRRAGLFLFDEGVRIDFGCSIYNWRIIEPRQFILTTAFDF